MSVPRKTQISRLPFLDWTRGFAAVVMLQGHVFHSFTRNDLRDTSPYVLSQFVGGLPPAVFLFLAGVTLAFLMDSRERQGLAATGRVVAALRRAGYLFGMAFLFRVQLWMFAWGQSSWTDLFKVDILNCMGVAVAVLSLMAVFPTAERARLCVVLGAAIAAASPVVSQLDWTGVPALIRDYLAPDYRYFSFFPWAAFLAFGVGGGSILRMLSADQLNRAMQWTAMIGVVLIFGGQYFSGIPYSLYAKADFWLDSPALVFIKLGITMLILAFAYLWMQTYAASSWSWISQLGTTSLLVYWVHIELVYGRWFGSWKESLGLPQSTAAVVAVVLLMLGLSVARTRLKKWDWGRLQPAAQSVEP